MKKANEQSLGDAIKQFLKVYRMEDKITEVRIHKAWETVMGHQIGQLTQKVTFSRSTLTVYLKSAPLREELSLGKSKIIVLINKEVGQNAVQEIVFR